MAEVLEFYKSVSYNIVIFPSFSKLHESFRSSVRGEKKREKRDSERRKTRNKIAAEFAKTKYEKQFQVMLLERLFLCVSEAFETPRFWREV